MLFLLLVFDWKSGNFKSWSGELLKGAEFTEFPLRILRGLDAHEFCTDLFLNDQGFWEVYKVLIFCGTFLWSASFNNSELALLVVESYFHSLGITGGNIRSSSVMAGKLSPVVIIASLRNEFIVTNDALPISR